MRLLHTSDWHLGRHLRAVPLVDHQRDFLSWLADLARDQQVDAVLVSGDVYDRAIPSVEAVALLEQALVTLTRICPVVLISGNHDSATRLGFGGPLLEAAGVHLRSDVSDVDRPVELGDGELLVYGVPYLEPELVRGALAADKSHEAVLLAAMDRVRGDLDRRRSERAAQGLPAPRSVVLAHAFIVGGQPSESERDISVGGVAHAPASVFQGMDYVALGHLHGPQAVSSPAGTVARYSGSPLAYSFSEEAHVKSVAVVEVTAEGVDVQTIPTPAPRPLATITGDLEDLLADSAHEAAEGAWVRAIVTDARRPEQAMDRLRARFPHAIELMWAPHADGVPLTTASPGTSVAGNDPVEVITSFIEHVTGRAASDDDVIVARASIERVRAAEANA